MCAQLVVILPFRLAGKKNGYPAGMEKFKLDKAKINAPKS